jgi:hypothetical protein
MASALDLMGLGALAAAGAIIVALAIILVIAIYIYSSLALMTIANKTRTKNAWLAWIPIANVYLIVQIARQEWWQIFALALYFIPVIGGIALLAVMAFWYWKIAERRKKPGWLGILTIIPIVNLIVLGILAWAD